MKKLCMLTVLFLALTCGIVCYSAGVTPLTFFAALRSSALAAAAPQDAARASDSPSSVAPSMQTQTRGVWVATAYSIDYPAQPTTDADTLRAECRTALDRIAASGANTVYFQVRPSCDALYCSQLFPWSRYLTGTCGTAPSDSFDPLAYWVEQAHARNLRLEAWVNPYRICAGANAQSDFDALPDSSPAKQHPEWVVSCDGGYYFNPGIAEVRQLICDGVSEIVSKYAVDGIQFDDYFYPSTQFDDAAVYRASGSNLPLADWRRDNVNQLVQAVNTAVHQNAMQAGCRFGISPSGIWRNKGANAFTGSATHGFEHYSSSYADSVTWIKNGWIDYICPQIYWQIGDTAADFQTLANWWSHQVRGTDVQLVLGLAAYKIGDSQYGDVWANDGCGEIGRQLDLAAGIQDIDGCALFSYQNLRGNDTLFQTVQERWK